LMAWLDTHLLPLQCIPFSSREQNGDDACNNGK